MSSAHKMDLQIYLSSLFDAGWRFDLLGSPMYFRLRRMRSTGSTTDFRQRERSKLWPNTSRPPYLAIFGTFFLKRHSSCQSTPCAQKERPPMQGPSSIHKRQCLQNHASGARGMIRSTLPWSTFSDDSYNIIKSSPNRKRTPSSQGHRLTPLSAPDQYHNFSTGSNKVNVEKDQCLHPDISCEITEPDNQASMCEIQMNSPMKNTSVSSDEGRNLSNINKERLIHLGHEGRHFDDIQNRFATLVLWGQTDTEGSEGEFQRNKNKFDMGETIPVPDIDLPEESDLDDNMRWEWDKDTERFRHWDEEDQQWVYYPEQFD